MPLIHLRTRKLEYKFEIVQKYNLIIGESGVGKSTLVNTLNALMAEPATGTIDGYKKIRTDHDLRLEDLKVLEGYVIFIDEFCSLLKRYDISSVLRDSKNYFVIISRDETLGFKSISLDCVFRMHTSGKFHELRKAYRIPERMFSVETIVCEDSRAGYMFVLDRFKKLRVSVQYAKASDNDKTGGKSKIAEYLGRFEPNARLCIVFDKSAIGYDFHRILNSIAQNKLQVCMIDWDSFECYVLESEMFGVKVPNPMNEYESKEELATMILRSMITYNKTGLPLCLKCGGCAICEENGCKYRITKESDLLLYWKVGDLIDLLQRAKLDNMSVF